MAFRLQFPFFKISMQWKRQRTLTDVLGHLNVKLSSFPCVNGSPSKLVCCPVCCHTLAASQINDHLDSCLQVKVEPPVTIELDKTCSCSEKVVEVSNYSQLFPEEYSVCEKEQKPCLADGCTLDVDYFDCEKLTAQLKVFRQELDFSLFNHRRLFIEEEMKIVQQVHSLSSRLQNLFQNILGRKNKTWHSFREFSNLWYNGSKYSEEDFYLLKDLGLIQPFQVETDLRFEEIMRILNLLNVKELKQAYRQLFLCNVEYRGKQKLILELCECLAKKVVAHGTQRRMNGQSPRKDCWNYVTSQLVYVFRVPDQVSVLFDNMHRLFYIPNSTETPLNLLAAIGRLKFARYTCSCTRPLFLSRNAFIEFVDATRDEEAFDAALSNENSDTIECISSKAHAMLEKYLQCKVSNSGEILLPSLEQVNHPIFKMFSGLWIFCSICWHSINYLERRKYFETSIKRLSLLLDFKNICSHRRGRYWNRLSLDILHSGGSVFDVLQVCHKALEDKSLNDGERSIIARRTIRLIRTARKKGEVGNSELDLQKIMKVSRRCTVNNPIDYWHSLPEDCIVGRPVNWSKYGRNLFFGQNEQLLGVEELCLEHYSFQGWNGIHCEGSLMNTLFGIFFWDILFMDVADVFQNEYQRAPLDLGTEAFYPSRSAEIERRISDILHYTKEDILNEVSRISQEHYPEGNLSVFMFHNTLLLKFLYQECLGVNWLLLGSLETLALVASLIPPSILAGCFEKLAKNYRYWSGGQPDLFLWRTAPEEQVKFVEVKGPSDRLSERQHFWICLLMSFGANAAVAKVKPEDVKETLH